MLSTQHDRAYMARLALIIVLNCHLALSIRAQPSTCTTLPNALKLSHDAVGEHNGGWHQLRRFVASVAEHHALVTCALLFPLSLVFINTKRDIRALLAD